MRRVLLFGVVCLLLGHTLGIAQGHGGGTTGKLRCIVWTRAAAERTSGQHNDAMLFNASRASAYGFVMGAAYTAQQRLRGIEPVGVDGWIDQYCAAHPDDSVADAAAALIEELRPARR
jgi:hypothetical protein